MTKRKDRLAELWQMYINQGERPSRETISYVQALKGRVDILEHELAIVKAELRKYQEPKS
jgi:uncharacterized small protein (DUF1192 family)